MSNLIKKPSSIENNPYDMFFNTLCPTVLSYAVVLCNKVMKKVKQYTLKNNE